MLNLVPMPYRILAVVLLAAALVAFGFVKGMQHEERKADAERVDRERETTTAYLRQAQRSHDIMSDALVLEGVKNEQIRAIGRRLDTALDGLRDRPERAATPAAAASSPAACAGVSGAELARGDAAFLTRYSADAARLHAAVKTCEARYESLRTRINEN